MTTEEKAKRYDEALAMAKECITYVPADAVNRYMLNIFPELKEDKDEKIRKELIHQFTTLDPSWDTWRGMKRADILAWLEKQGEENPLKGTLGDVFDDLRAGLDPSPKQGQVKEFIIPQHEIKTCKENDDSLTSEDERIRKEMIFYFQKEIPQCSIQEHADKMKEFVAWLKKKGEQKPTPQTNERSWLYLVADVLTWKDGIGQYLDDPYVQKLAKKLEKDYSSKLFVKEQDERNPIEYSLVQAAEIFLDSLAKTPYNNKPVTDAQVITKELLKFLSDTNSYNPDALIEKPAWSEEDERIMSAISQLLKDCESENGWNCVYYNDREVFFDDIENYLQSLKNRIVSQPKQEWNEEDERKISDILALLRGGENCHYNTSELFNWLKSLRPQNRWKSSDGQMDMKKLGK